MSYNQKGSKSIPDIFPWVQQVHDNKVQVIPIIPTLNQMVCILVPKIYNQKDPIIRTFFLGYNQYYDRLKAQVLPIIPKLDLMV